MNTQFYPLKKQSLRQVSVSRGTYNPDTDKIDLYLGTHNSILYQNQEGGGGGGSCTCLSAISTLCGEVSSIEDRLSEIDLTIAELSSSIECSCNISADLSNIYSRLQFLEENLSDVVSVLNIINFG